MTIYSLSLDVQGVFSLERPIIQMYYGGKKIGAAYVNATPGHVTFTIDTALTFSHTLLRFSFAGGGMEVGRSVDISNIKIDTTDLVESGYVSNKAAIATATTLTLHEGSYADYDVSGVITDTILLAPASIDGGALADKLYGAAGNDTMHGNAGNDILYGREGNDTIYGGTENDTLYGESGNDRIYGDDGNDTILGGIGDDAILDGGLGNDKIYGEDGNDTLFGKAGVDILQGGNGNDRLWGGDGDDFLYVNEGLDDRAYGENGNDKIYGGTGDNILDGGNGNDVIKGYAGNDTLYGQAGDDTMNGDEGNDYLYGGTGVDKLYGADGADTLRGFDGNDFLYGNAGDDVLAGENDDDYISSGDGNDTANGGAGNDIMLGEDGNDTVDGDGGNDILIGGFGIDVVRGDGGVDILYGGGMDGFDVYTMLQANAGVIFNAKTQSFYKIVTTGASWADANTAAQATMLNGVAGRLLTIETQVENDYIFTQVQAGGSAVWLGASDGASEGHWIWESGLAGGYEFASNDASVNKLYENFGVGQSGNGASENALAMSVSGVALDSWLDEDGATLLHYVIEWDSEALMADLSANNMQSGTENDILFGAGGNDTMTGVAGDDVMFGGDGGDAINGGDDQDVIFGNAGVDQINGGNGDDILYGGADGDTRLDGDAGNDVIYGEGGDDVLTGDVGDDVLYGGDGVDTINGGLDSDLLYGENGNDRLLSGGGNDTLYGGDGDDYLDGSTENDTLYGGAGADDLRGGAGDDLIYFDATDTVRGGLDNDTIRIENLLSFDLSLSEVRFNSGIESIDMENGADNELTVTVSGIISKSDTDSLWVTGDLGQDTVVSSNIDASHRGADVVSGATTFAHYSSAGAELYIELGLSFNGSVIV